MHKEIKLELYKNKIKQSDAARSIGLSRVTLSRYLHGKTQLRSEKFTKLITMLGWRIEREKTSGN